MAGPLEVILATAVVLGGLTAFLAGLVLWAGPRRRENRDLAAYLGLVSVNFWANVAQVQWMSSNEVLAYRMFLFVQATNVSIALSYLLFVGVAVDAPMSRPIRRPFVRRALQGATLLVVPLAYAGHAWLVPEPAHADFFERSWSTRLDLASALLFVGVFAFALLAAFSAFARAARGSLARRRAKAYLVGFAVIDAALVLGNGVFVLTRSLGIDLRRVPEAQPYGFAIYAIMVGGYLLLAAALLRFQLIGFELKVKWTIARGSLLAVFLGVFLVVSQVAEQYLQSTQGYLVGGLAAGLMLFALRPVERLADRLAARAMPGVEPTPAYLQFKKLEVYKAAVESAHETGGVDARERASLDRLREKLGLDARDAAAIEAEVTAT